MHIPALQRPVLKQVMEDLRAKQREAAEVEAKLEAYNHQLKPASSELERIETALYAARKSLAAEEVELQKAKAQRSVEEQQLVGVKSAVQCLSPFGSPRPCVKPGSLSISMAGLAGPSATVPTANAVHNRHLMCVCCVCAGEAGHPGVHGGVIGLAAAGAGQGDGRFGQSTLRVDDPGGCSALVYACPCWLSVLYE
eukprot:1156876-Pelagomonas_calceolata.AAC.16